MKKLIEYIVKLIVDDKDKVQVEERAVGENMYNYIVKTVKDDTGKVIGKEGKIIHAIRNVAKVLAIKEGKQIRIEVGET